VNSEGEIMPYINIKHAGALTREQKKEIAKEVTETMQRVANKPASYTYITFDEVDYEDWAIGGKLLDD
jgi:4-oxalocrotonate tautomerase